MTVKPYTIDIPQAVIDDLCDRLRGTIWPDQITGAGWAYGTELDYLRSLVTDWARFDWHATQERLNKLPHVRVEVAADQVAGGTGFGVHAIHQRADAPEAVPVVLPHGWPSSFVQMLPILPLLPDFHLVALSLPGYGFSDRPTASGMDVARIAGIVVDVMAQLGYSRFAARGSDLGAGVLQQLALTQPDRLTALHLSGTNPYLGYIPDDLSAAEQQFVEAAQRWNQAEMAYAMEHSSKPQTLSYGLTDSPVGLAAWIVEKFRTWSDCGGDLDSVYDRDDLLTNLTVYWATRTIGSSMRLYYETARSTTAAWGRVEVPTGMAMSGADMFPTPREWVQRSYNVVHWTDLPRGGHSLEWEQPQLIADDLRAFLHDHH
jgi:pimeloyl-ACP methyl ester carboxylesterase